MYLSIVFFQQKLQSPEAREDQFDWSAAANHRADERRRKRGDRSAQNTQNSGEENKLHKLGNYLYLKEVKQTAKNDSLVLKM